MQKDKIYCAQRTKKGSYFDKKNITYLFNRTDRFSHKSLSTSQPQICNSSHNKLSDIFRFLNTQIYMAKIETVIF